MMLEHLITLLGPAPDEEKQDACGKLLAQPPTTFTNTLDAKGTEKLEALLHHGPVSKIVADSKTSMVDTVMRMEGDLKAVVDATTKHKVFLQDDGSGLSPSDVLKEITEAVLPEESWQVMKRTGKLVDMRFYYQAVCWQHCVGIHSRLAMLCQLLQLNPAIDKRRCEPGSEILAELSRVRALLESGSAFHRQVAENASMKQHFGKRDEFFSKGRIKMLDDSQDAHEQLGQLMKDGDRLLDVLRQDWVKDAIDLSSTLHANCVPGWELDQDLYANKELMQKLIDNPHYTSLGPRIALLEKVRAGMKVVNKDGPFFQANVIKELSTTIGHGSKTVTNTYVAFKIAKQFVLIENASARKNEITALEKAMTNKGVAELVNASLRAALTALKDAAWTP